MGHMACQLPLKVPVIPGADGSHGMTGMTCFPYSLLFSYVNKIVFKNFLKFDIISIDLYWSMTVLGQF